MSSKRSVVKAVISPTWLLADVLKPKDPVTRTWTIKRLNWIYLGFSIVAVAGLFLVEKMWGVRPCAPLTYLWGAFLLSRCNEVFLAFLQDAQEHFDGKDPRSNLSYGDRLALSLLSYVELMLNFAMIFYFVPPTYWKDNRSFSSIIESVYFSGATITTTGYGDITPVNPVMQILSIYEVFCGVILLVVCFTIYASKGMALRDAKLPPKS